MPVLAFIGVVTFQRLVQSSFEDIAYAQRIARLRDFYVAVAPEIAPYVLVIRDSIAVMHGHALRPTVWQLTLTTAGMVAVVNSVVLGACAGLLLADFDVGSLAAGAIVGIAALSVQRRHHRRARNAYKPEAVDRTSIFVPPTQPAEAA